MNKLSMNKQVQSGFTLIELIVVIVILGILAATALPKFAALGGDARLASLQAARGALASTSAMAHAKYLVDVSVQTSGTTTVEGKTITFPVSPAVATGYPLANSGLVDAAGLDVDYTAYTTAGGGAGTGRPVTVAGDVALVPNSIAGTPTAVTCFVLYRQSTALNTPPTITVTGTSTTCQ